ncbi:zf-CCHC domain-containing protein [Tanacetum coccineum]
MAQENYVERFSMQRPSLLEPNDFCFWKARFETYVKSKDIDLWQVIQNGDFYFEVEDEETKLMKETLYELLKDIEKKQLGKNEEAKMTIYNALPRKEYERVFMCKTAKERRAKVTAIEEAKDLATLPRDELIGNLKVYEMVLDNDGVASKITTQEKELPSKPKGACYNCGIEGQFASECRKPKENKAFIRGAWSDSEDGDGQLNDETCLMVIDSQEVFLKCDLLPDDWIVDSGCTKHMTGNRRLFTSYKACDGRHVC